MTSLSRFCLLLAVVMLCAMPAAAADDAAKEWLKLRLSEVSLEAPFAFLPKRDGRSGLPPGMADQFVSFDIYESDTKASLPMHVNMVRIQYKEADKVNLDGTVQSTFRAVAAEQGDKEPRFDQNTLKIDGLEGRRIHYNGLGMGKPVSVETVAAKQGPVLWSVMVTYNKTVPRDWVIRLLDSVHFAPPQAEGAIPAPGAPEAGQWLITSMDEVTLEAPFQFSARKDARDQVPDAARSLFASYDNWQGSGRPALPLEITLSRLVYKDAGSVSMTKQVENNIQAIAAKAGDDASAITSTESKRDGLATTLIHYDGLARGKKLASDILLAADGPRVWMLQMTWSAGVPAEAPARVLASVHIITPSPVFSLSATAEEKHTLPQDLISTYVWCGAMKATLEDVARAQPSLAGEAVRAGLEWDNVFKPALEAVGKRIKEGSGKDWEAILAQMNATLSTGGAQAFTLDQGREVVAAARRHSRGEMPAHVLRMLLASMPAYKLQPAREMTDGYAGAYATVTSPKASGLRYSLRYPLSWMPTTSDSPEVLAQWTSDGGHGEEWVRLCASPLPANATPETAEAGLSNEGSRTLVPAGGTFVRFREGRLNDRPLGILHFTLPRPGDGAGAPVRCVMYYFFTTTHMISVQALCSPAADNEAAREDRFHYLEPLFQAVVGSLKQVD